MDKLRMRFEKKGSAIYTSHLDLMRNMQRSFSRAGLELKYSEGFNPHPKISILVPLPLGCSSNCELMDFELNNECDIGTLADRLTSAMPEGLKVTEVYYPTRKVVELKWIEVEGIFEYDTLEPENAASGLRELFNSDSIIITKKTKRGIGETDIKPGISKVDFVPGDKCVTVKAVLSAIEPTIGPNLLVDAIAQLKNELSPDFAEFTRIETYDSNMSIFR